MKSSCVERQTSSSVPTPWKHQSQTKSFFSSRPRGNDFSDPGTGKTRAHLDVYTTRRAPGRLLILCPKTLMYSAWMCDIERFAPGMTASLAYAENREEAFKAKTDAVITNIDAVRWLADQDAKLLKDFDHCIIDESTAYKTPTSQRSKALIALRRFFKYRYALTGTPNPNSVTELWNPMLFIDDGKRLGTSFYKLRNVMQVSTQIGPGINHVRWDDKPGAQQAVDELIADITIRHEFEKVMPHVPKNHKDTKFFLLNKKCATAYKEMEATAILQIKQEVVSAVHAAALRTKLLQIASGAVYGGSSENDYVVVDTQRYELIADLVEERGHSVVFFNWKHQRDELCREFANRDIRFAVIDGNTPQRDRDRIVADYQSGKYKTLLLHPRTGAHGLTLTRGTTTIISSPFYEADMLKQAIHRIYRGGQTEVTNTILICAAGTVEEKVYERLDDKYGRMVDLLTLIQNRSTK